MECIFYLVQAAGGSGLEVSFFFPSFTNTNFLEKGKFRKKYEKKKEGSEADQKHEKN